MKLAINEFVVRHRTTGKIWFRCICLNDQDNNVIIDEVFPDYRSEQADEFNDNFAGHRNVRYLSNTKNFVCGTETTITKHTVAELVKRATSDKVFVVCDDEDGRALTAFRTRDAAEQEAAERNTVAEARNEWNQALKDYVLNAESVKKLKAAFLTVQATGNTDKTDRAYREMGAEKYRLIQVYTEANPFKYADDTSTAVFVESIPLI